MGLLYFTCSLQVIRAGTVFGEVKVQLILPWLGESRTHTRQVIWFLDQYLGAWPPAGPLPFQPVGVVDLEG
jgi:hypothetical protein